MKKTTKIKTANKTNYLKESKTYILGVVTLFVANILIGVIYSNTLSKVINPLLKDLVDQTINFNALELAIFIFFNNVLTSFLGFILGIFLSIFPIIVAISNGVILGYVLERTAQVSVLEFWRLLPHGIFELPAVFISLGMGAKLGIDTVKFYIKNNKNKKSFQVLGILSLILALIGILLLKSSFSILSSEESNLYSDTLFMAFVSIVLIFPFIFFFFIKNKKVRQYNISNIFSAFKIFIFLVVPLLIIAAVIESLLIVLS